MPPVELWRLDLEVLPFIKGQFSEKATSRQLVNSGKDLRR